MSLSGFHHPIRKNKVLYIPERLYDPTKPYKNDIKKWIKGTWETPYVTVKDNKNGYPIVIRKFDRMEVDHTDGIGTKGIYYWKKRYWAGAVQDAFAMNLNDLATVGATPFKMQNHIILQEDDSDAILQIIEEIYRFAKLRQIAITGGETSIQNNIQGMDLSITMSGFLEKEPENKFLAGDVIVGLPSTGLHANGITLARKVLPEDWVDVYCIPTAIYYDTVVAMEKKYPINGRLHIAGGAYTRLKSALDGVDAKLKFSGMPIPSTFAIIAKKVSDKDMYSTFNCGYGFLLSVAPAVADEIINEYGYNEARRLGYIEEGNGSVYVRSSFTGEEFEL